MLVRGGISFRAKKMGKDVAFLVFSLFWTVSISHFPLPFPISSQAFSHLYECNSNFSPKACTLADACTKESWGIPDAVKHCVWRAVLEIDSVYENLQDLTTTDLTDLIYACRRDLKVPCGTRQIRCQACLSSGPYRPFCPFCPPSSAA